MCIELKYILTTGENYFENKLNLSRSIVICVQKKYYCYEAELSKWETVLDPSLNVLRFIES